MSVWLNSVESMFDVELPGAAAITALDNAGLVDAIVDTSKLDSAILAKRFIAIGELWDRRQRQAPPESEYFVMDTLEQVAAELGAAMGITCHRAAGLIRIAEALHDRLPQVCAAFERGDLDYGLVSAIVYRTELIQDPDRVAEVDAALAQHAAGWTAVPRTKIAELVDSWVARFDPAGVRAPRDPEHHRFLDIRPTYEGMAGIWGAVAVPDAVVLDQRIAELIATVCPDDPRTRSQRRADAMRALAERATRMPCRCGAADCPGAPATPADNVVLHVLAESDTVDGASAHPGYAMGFGPVNATTVRELAHTARRKPVLIPADAAPDTGYRPSAAHAEFVRFRDLTCRWPGCDCPAERTDIDHTIPYPRGLTHPSNNKLFCRRHHLIKTFCAGWHDRQLADGTVIFTSPTGHTYTTKPGGSLFFPALAVPTGEPPPPPPMTEPHPNRTAMMPKRKRTRADERAYRIALERRRNAARIGDDPPPF
jgi:hypothetical protein